ncbi:MAG: efflux RND transporter permease subunit [Planctomycetia bacterium]|nr:efflux RND transporter permease subunit [Planctomycetia bacterium]
MLPKFAVNNRIVILFLAMLVAAGGIWSYETLGRLEDPEFTLKTALVITIYPGASAKDVEEHVTDIVERGVRRLKGVDFTRSISSPGLSIIYVDMVPTTKGNLLHNAWEELRYKVGEIQRELPPEALPPIVKDDFGEVYGIVLALCADDGFSPAEHLDCARTLQREMGLLEEVGRVELWGVQKECIEVEISRSRMAELAIPPALALSALARQNLSFESGKMTVGDNVIRIAPTGKFQSIDEIGDLVISGAMSEVVNQITQKTTETLPGGTATGFIQKQATASTGGGVGAHAQQVRLRDIATIRRTTIDPPSEICRFNGKEAIAIAISPQANGNVVRMGELVRERSQEVLESFPLGYSLEVVSYQPDNVNVAVHAFMKNLYEAVIIVTVVVMIAMGLRSGILITSSLLIVILATMCCLLPMGVVLQRTSLGAFIVALGILVDDAVVVGDLILVRMQRGMKRKEACIEGARRAANQLLGATVVGMLAFLPIYLSPDLTGEYCASLFLVVAVSLAISWFVAMLQTPVVYYYFVHVKGERRDEDEDSAQDQTPAQNLEPQKDPHGGPVYRFYRHSLEWVLHHRLVTLGVVLLALAAAVVEFRHVKQIFFPGAQRTQFMVDYWLPEGASIHAVSQDMKGIEQYLLTLENVVGVTTFAGGGPPRFYLPYEPQLPNSSYGQIVVNVESIQDVDRWIKHVDVWLKDNYPQAMAFTHRFAMGPITPHEVEVRFRGPDSKVLRSLSAQAEAILHDSPYARNVCDNWRQLKPALMPEFSQTRGKRAGLSRSDMLLSLTWATSGLPVASFPDGDKNLPIYVRGLTSERNNIETIENAPIWGLLPQSAALGEIASTTPLVWEEGQICRRNRLPTITVGADALDVQWTELLADVRPKIEAIPLPEGYSLEWGGQEEQSLKATNSVLGQLPIALIFMAIIVVALFNDLRQPLIIVLTFPLAMIGITFGLLLFDKPFGFMALLGAMSLLGMVVRNGVVLMDQIDEEMKKGDSPYMAIVDASVERMRPVVVAAMTVVVGMIPLLKDPLFDSMATAVMFGLIVATFLTLFVVPVLYSFFFRVKLED